MSPTCCLLLFFPPDPPAGSGYHPPLWSDEWTSLPQPHATWAPALPAWLAGEEARAESSFPAICGSLAHHQEHIQHLGLPLPWVCEVWWYAPISSRGWCPAPQLPPWYHWDRKERWQSNFCEREQWRMVHIAWLSSSTNIAFTLTTSFFISYTFSFNMCWTYQLSPTGMP